MCNTNCGVNHDTVHQDVTHWKDCERKCFTHCCAKEEDAADPSSEEHQRMALDECVLEGCDWHGQDNTEKEKERLDQARAHFDKLYAGCDQEQNAAYLGRNPEEPSDADSESGN